ncbi:MAG: thioredoxin family protein [Gammaproteobacteria bacterium]
MVLIPSTMMPLGTKAPNFTLSDVVTSTTVTLYDLPPSQGTLIMFICNHCPYVKHIHDVLIDVTKSYSEKGIQCLGISANDAINFPEDAPDKMKEYALKYSYSFPYLYDEEQTVAKAYDAVCTPDFFLFDKQYRCVYRGQFDGSRPGNQLPVTGSDLCRAMDFLLEGKPIPSEQTPSVGCNIKWKQ